MTQEETTAESTKEETASKAEPAAEEAAEKEAAGEEKEEEEEKDEEEEEEEEEDDEAEIVDPKEKLEEGELSPHSDCQSPPPLPLRRRWRVAGGGWLRRIGAWRK